MTAQNKILAGYLFRTGPVPPGTGLISAVRLGHGGATDSYRADYAPSIQYDIRNASLIESFDIGMIFWFYGDAGVQQIPLLNLYSLEKRFETDFVVTR